MGQSCAGTAEAAFATLFTIGLLDGVRRLPIF
jgi:hypothetical protein